MAKKVKHKTRKAVAKRFKRSANGKILHKKPGRRHLAASKTRKQKRRLRQSVQAGGKFAKSLSNEMGL
jgi:ribosomal protein L35